jgi:hypothetical protein
MSALCGGSMIMTIGQLSRSANTPQTLQRPHEGHALRGATSSTSTPNSLNYFDLLSEEVDHPETVPQPAAKPQNTGKMVRFAELPQVNRGRKTPETTRSAPPPRPMKKKNGQQQLTKPPSMDPAQPREAQAPAHDAPTPIRTLRGIGFFNKNSPYSPAPQP